MGTLVSENLNVDSVSFRRKFLNPFLISSKKGYMLGKLLKDCDDWLKNLGRENKALEMEYRRFFKAIEKLIVPELKKIGVAVAGISVKYKSFKNNGELEGIGRDVEALTNAAFRVGKFFDKNLLVLGFAKRIDSDKKRITGLEKTVGELNRMVSSVKGMGSKDSQRKKLLGEELDRAKLKIRKLQTEIDTMLPKMKRMGGENSKYQALKEDRDKLKDWLGTMRFRVVELAKVANDRDKEREAIEIER